MAASEDRSGCLVSRGRSQSDPSVLTESSAAASAEAGENPGNEAGRGRPGGGRRRGAHSQALLRAPACVWGAPSGPGARAPPFTSPETRPRRRGALCPERNRFPRVEPGAGHQHGWWVALSPPRDRPSLGADQPGEECQTCGGLELCLPPLGPQLRWPGVPALAGQRPWGHRPEWLPLGAHLRRGPTHPTHLGAPPTCRDR